MNNNLIIEYYRNLLRLESLKEDYEKLPTGSKRNMTKEQIKAKNEYERLEELVLEIPQFYYTESDSFPKNGTNIDYQSRGIYILKTFLTGIRCQKRSLTGITIFYIVNGNDIIPYDNIKGFWDSYLKSLGDLFLVNKTDTKLLEDFVTYLKDFIFTGSEQGKLNYKNTCDLLKVFLSDTFTDCDSVSLNDFSDATSKFIQTLNLKQDDVKIIIFN